MSCEKWSFSKILPIVYSVLTLLNVSRLAYMTGITIVVSGGFNDPPPTLFQKVGMYLCVIYMVLIHVALISTVILVCFEKTKPFYIVAAIDFAVYVFCLIYFESQGALSEKAFVYIPACIIQAVIFFITIFYGYKQNRINQRTVP